MATIRKRTLSSGKVRWQVDFFDQGGNRRAKLFERKKDADLFLVSARALVQAGRYLHDAGSITVGMAADAWLGHCRLRRDAGRRMERRTCRGYEDMVRLHIKDPQAGIAGTKLSRLTRKAVNEFRDRLLASGRSEGTTRSACCGSSSITLWTTPNCTQTLRRGCGCCDPVESTTRWRSRRKRT